MFSPSLILNLSIPVLDGSKYSGDSSLNGKKPCLDEPNSTNIASRLPSIFVIFPLCMLPFWKLFPSNSRSKSMSLSPSINALLLPLIEFVSISIFFILSFVSRIRTTDYACILSGISIFLKVINLFFVVLIIIFFKFLLTF